MKSATHKMFAITAGMLLLAAVLGGSLGVAAGKGRNDGLVAGQNYIGPVGNQSVAPGTWLACLPVQSWSAVYSWDRNAQQWKHYFNTSKGVPAYVNLPEVGGITLLVPPEGVALIMDVAVPNPWFKDTPSEACPP